MHMCTCLYSHMYVCVYVVCSGVCMFMPSIRQHVFVYICSPNSTFTMHYTIYLPLNVYSIDSPIILLSLLYIYIYIYIYIFYKILINVIIIYNYKF